MAARGFLGLAPRFFFGLAGGRFFGRSTFMRFTFGTLLFLFFEDPPPQFFGGEDAERVQFRQAAVRASIEPEAAGRPRVGQSGRARVEDCTGAVDGSMGRDHVERAA